MARGARGILFLAVAAIVLLPIRHGHATKCTPRPVPARVQYVKIGPVTDADGVPLTEEDALWPTELVGHSRRGADSSMLLDLDAAYAGQPISAVQE